MELEGTIKLIEDTQQITNTFRKRGVVVTTEEQYPQHIMVEFVQDKTDMLDSFQVGDKVNIGINLRGREWTSPQGEVKYFNTIQGWRIEKKEAAGSAEQPVTAAPPMPPLPEEDDDDLPF
jgi:translation initiation factor IF-3